jgi:hypothetical protein
VFLKMLKKMYPVCWFKNFLILSIFSKSIIEPYAKTVLLFKGL